MVDKCKYIRTTLYSDVKLKHTPDVVRDLTVSLNNMLADFSFVDSSTLSRLFDSYCMNLYGSQLFRYNDIKSMELLYVTWRKSIRKIWKISPRSHCNLLHHINSCDSIDNIMEKRCIKFIWNLMNSDTILFDRTVKHSLSMLSNTLGKNIRYFMFKYGIYMSEWYGPLSVLHRKIQKYIIKETSIINKCTGIAIRDICNAIDSNVYIMPDTEYISIIDIYCKYHYAIRKIKNKNLKLRKEAMANAISQNNSRQLWDEIKKVRNINPTYSNCVDVYIILCTE